MNQPNILWTTKLSQPALTSPIVVGNYLLFAAKSSSPMNPHSDLIALNLDSGQVAWQHHFEYALISGLQAYTMLASPRHLPSPRHFASPRHLRSAGDFQDITLGIVATQSSDLLHGQGEVLAFDADGNVVWQWHGEEKSYAAPVVQEMQVLVLAGTSTLVIVSPEGEGDESVTRIDLPISSSTAAPTIRDNIAYIPCRTPELLAIDLNTNEQYRFRTLGNERNWLDQTPVLAEDSVFVVGRLGTVYALDSYNLKLRWQQEIGNKRSLSQPAVDGDRLFVGFRYGLSVLDGRSGQPIWTFPTSRAISAPPLILGDVVYVSCEDHHLYALDKMTGDELWRLEMGRRINISPVLTPSCLLVVDRGGQVVALEPPDLPEEVLVKESTNAQMRKEVLAKRLMERGEYGKAAEFWLGLGQLETAADAYEQAEVWLQAADLWQQLDRDGKRADALQRHAQSLAKQEIDEEEIAAAWGRAARAHAELGQREARQRCEREAARYRRLPILSLEIEVKDLTINQWSKLDFVVKNDGFGPARHVGVNLVDDRFVGRAKHSATWVTVMPNKQYAHWLEVRPQAQGDDVPMQLLVEYVDRTGNNKTLERTFYLPVTGELGTAGSSAHDTGSREFARLESPDGRDLTALRKNLSASFSRVELDDLLLSFNLNPQDFDSHLSVKAREIIIWAVQHKQLNELIAYCQRERHNIDW
ncbi:MAG: PQQ-binding-like beta-propeller repeat protein [Chloroflexi bacterium]|nr:PQQ-binding-like beta-propeller repeat protein [Chloroflexota bacterium]